MVMRISRLDNKNNKINDFKVVKIFPEPDLDILIDNKFYSYPIYSCWLLISQYFITKPCEVMITDLIDNFISWSKNIILPSKILPGT